MPRAPRWAAPLHCPRLRQKLAIEQPHPTHEQIEHEQRDSRAHEPRPQVLMKGHTVSRRIERCFWLWIARATRRLRDAAEQCKVRLEARVLGRIGIGNVPVADRHWDDAIVFGVTSMLGAQDERAVAIERKRRFVAPWRRLPQ